MTREIPLSRGLVALIDDADYDTVVSVGKWSAKESRGRFYGRRRIPTPRGEKQRSILMHTFITGWGFVDHINGDGLDNRRENLRPATVATNLMNRGVQSNNTSGFKGVTRRDSKWRAQISTKDNYFHLGIFATPEDAARAYDAAAAELFGEFAWPNFPKEISA
ncbi:MAG TPA: AP2 domain-containing protein [Propionibacteriaceae bacterium]